MIRRRRRAARSRSLAGLERLEDRRLLDADPDLIAYQQRADQVLDGNVAAIRAWATATASTPDNASTSGISMWTAAAAFARAASDPALLPIAEKAAASLLAKRTTALFAGGNDGWEAWATADTCLRYRGLIAAATGRYAPTGLAANPVSVDGKYSLAELFQFVLTRSVYAPIDSTSNHVLMNATARYLAEQAYPGQVVNAYNNSTSDPTGAGTILSRARSLVTGGPAEYLSLNYGAYNWAEFLSVHQLTTLPANAELARLSRIAFEAAFAMNAAYWMNGQLAGPVGRGYPNTGAWGASGGDSLTWTYLGGDYGQAAQQLAYATSTDVKTLGVLASVAQFGVGSVVPYLPTTALLRLDDPVPKITRSNFGTNHQYAYNTGRWSTSSESYKWDAFGPYQATWRSRTIWTKPERHDYDAVAWATNPATDPGPNANGSWNYVDPSTLQTWDLSGSGTYSGSSVFSDMVQNGSTVLQVYNIPPLAIAGTPGGKQPVRGTLIYVPVPKVIATGRDAADGDGWFRPVLSADATRLFVAYEGIFMCFVSTAPISLGTRVGQKQFYNIYGGTTPGAQADPNSFLQYAVAQETFSADDFPGTTFAEKFANFQTTMQGRLVPQLVKADTYHPAWRYADASATLTSEFGGLARYAKDPQALTKAFGTDTIGGPGNTAAQVVDYATWPLLEQRDLTGRTWVRQPEDGALTVTVPGQTPLLYDFASWRSFTGADIGLVATTPAGGRIQLGWRAGLGATSFTVERSADGQAWTTIASGLPGSATAYTDTGLTQGGTRLYRVTPIGTPLGTSVPAAATVAFNAPTDLRMTLAGTSQITLTWTNAAVGSTSVQLQYSLDGSRQWRWLVNLPASFTSRTVTYTDFTGGERVYYRALAYGAGPNGTTLFSPPSNVVGTEFSSGLVGGTTSMPRFLAASATPTRIDLTWQDTATNETGYLVERSGDEGLTWTAIAGSLPAGTTAYADSSVTTGRTYRYRVAARNGTATSGFSNVATAVAALPNTAPAVAAPASGPVVVRGTAAALAVLGRDDEGEPGLRYAWSVAAGPGSATFATNGSNAAKNTIATFSRAGTYTLVARIEDARGLSTTSATSVTVRQVLRQVALAPAQRVVRVGGSLPFTAVAADQFGLPMADPPAIAWRATSGSIDTTGRFTASASPGLAVVSAAADGQTATAQVTVQSQAVPLASYAFEEGGGSVAGDGSGNGFDAALSGGVAFGPGATIKGSATGGLVFSGTGVATIGDPTALAFSGAITLSAWVKPSGTAGIQSIVEKGYNTGSNAGEIFLRINGGSYQVGSYDGGTYLASATIPSGDVGQWVHLLGTYDVAQQRWVLYRNGVQAAASAVTTKGALPVTGRGWTIGATALGNRFFTGSIDEVRIGNTSTPAADAAAVYRGFQGPSLATAVAAVPTAPATVRLSVLGGSPAGEAALTYSWFTLGTPPAPMMFSATGTNAAKSSVATFTANGTYQLAVVITDAQGAALVAPVTVVISDAADTVITVPTGDLATLPVSAGGSGRLIKRGGGTLAIGSPHAYRGGLVVDTGTVNLAATPAVGAGRLTIAAAGRVALAGDASLDGLTIAAGGGLDIGSFRLSVRGLAPAELTALLRVGLGDGSWNGTTGLSSSMVAGQRQAGLAAALGWVDAGDGSLIVAAAMAGDTNLDGVVDILDVAAMMAGSAFGSARAVSWSEGDFNYDGVLDELDLADFMAAGLFNAGP